MDYTTKRLWTFGLGHRLYILLVIACCLCFPGIILVNRLTFADLTCESLVPKPAAAMPHDTRLPHLRLHNINSVVLHRRALSGDPGAPRESTERRILVASNNVSSIIQSTPRASLPRGGLPNPAGPPGITKVLLYTYYRGGSSFLGDTFNNNPDVFYWFEPLAGITDNWGPAVWPKAVFLTREWYFEKNKTAKSFTSERLESLTSTLQSIFTCDLEQVPMQIYRHFFMVGQVWDKSVKMRGYKRCTQSTGGGVSEADVKRCLPILTEECRKSKVRVVKTIRLRMDFMDNILQKVPDLKVVHQIRDPRGLLNSWWHLFHAKQPEEAEMDAKLACHWLLYDIRARKLLEKKYPNTFYQNEYEEIATHPLSTSSKIYYEFLKLKIPESAYEWIWKSTHSEKDNGVIGTGRKNAAETANKWQKSLSPQYLKFTMFHCKDTLLEGGYSLDGSRVVTRV